MRLHQLTMTAFGPYAGTETVDFDELDEAGVFLLSGPTGAGKTSILDAICFALYGVVPGVREVKTLRSHHAADGVAPEVVLEATIGTRRYRIRRSPEWHRPKKRGAGFTRENACATLVEVEADGTERLVSSRIAEVGHELSMALGMSSEQFMQVVMLPQGDFQRFLRATSDERQGVLEKLFRTERFTRIEAWMKDRTRELAERVTLAEREVSQLLATIAHRAATELPAELSADRLGAVGATARAWADQALAAVRTSHADAVVAEGEAELSLERVREEEQRAVRLASTLARRAEAQQVLAELEDTGPDASADRDALDRHEAALRVRPLLQPLAELQSREAEAQATRDVALEALATLPEELQPATTDREGCTAGLGSLTDRLAALRATLPREQVLLRAGADMQAALGARDLLRDELHAVTERTAMLPQEREQAHRLLAEALAAGQTVDAARERLEQATVQHEAARRLPGARSSHADLSEQHLRAREDTAAARERHLAVVERRLAGMAAELAGQLTDGRPCQVCGSAEHPQPAQLDVDAVTEQDQDDAAAEAERLQKAADRLADRVAESSRDLHRLETAAAGLSAEQAAAHLAECRTAVTEAEAAVVATSELRDGASRLDQEAETLGTREVELREQVAARDAELTALRTTFEEAAREVAAVVGPGGGTVAEAVDRLEDARTAMQTAARTLELHETVRSRQEDAARLADEEAIRQAFGSAADAAAALLDEETVLALRRRLVEREERSRAASATLAETAELAGDGVAAPDLEATRHRLSAAVEQWRQANAAAASLAQCATALSALSDQLDTALARWEPAREEHATAEAMAKLVRGMGGDNQLQMRLSSYVLATRLDQVLEAANERLSHMRDQRYSLRRCGRTRAGARAGLGLEVLDTWTGEARAPSTLSGGETFVVSLSLALGLADVVTEEAGGTRVDTLFIDEGFGMLDPETLDDVMDRIDALRAGGRTVGVVSHVTELRGRIPTQVHVDRGRDGSKVTVRTLVP